MTTHMTTGSRLTRGSNLAPVPVPKFEGASSNHTSWLVVVFLLSLLQPSFTSIYVGELRLTIYRLILLFAVIPCLVKLFSGRIGRVWWCDWFILAHVMWVFTALCVVEGPATGLKTGGIYFVEAAGAYLMGRCFIRSSKSFASVAVLLCWIVILLAIWTIPEAVLGKHLFTPAEGNVGRRMGLERAYGPFDHPILLGVFCASAVGLSWYALGRDSRLRISKIARTVLICVSAIMSLSSGATAALVAQFILIFWDRLTQGWRKRWLLLVLLFMAAYVFVACFSNRTPMTVALYYLTFNAETAFGRVVIWDWGTAEISRHPMFGIGLGSWEHPTWISDSIDNFWLATAMLYGLPAFLTLAGAFLHVIIKVMRLSSPSEIFARLRKAWLTSMTGLIVAACTVFYWNAIFVLVFFMLGCGVWLLDTRRNPKLSQGK